MKTTLLIVIHLAFFSQSFSQNKALQDSLYTKNSSKQKILISCSPTIKNADSPLFVIDGVPADQNNNLFTELDPEDIVSIDILKGPMIFGCYGSLARNGAVLIKTRTGNASVVSCKEYPFRVYKILNENWSLMTDVYNSIRSKVPSVTIDATANSSNTPNIRMRGDNNTVVIVDGIRYDASILNTLNTNDITNIIVAPDVTVANYFLNN